jgi:hypothetical protein
MRGEKRAFVKSARIIVVDLFDREIAPLDLYPMVPGLRGTGNLASARTPSAGVLTKLYKVRPKKRRCWRGRARFSSALGEDLALLPLPWERISLFPLSLGRGPGRGWVFLPRNPEAIG